MEVGGGISDLAMLAGSFFCNGISKLRASWHILHELLFPQAGPIHLSPIPSYARQ